MASIQGKVAIVTGSARGIGAGIAARFGKEGAKVICLDRNPAAETVNHIKSNGGDAMAIQCDISKQASIEAAVRQVLDTYGTIDILVNSAGLSKMASITDATEADWDYVNNVTLKGTWLMIKGVAPTMKANKSGKIINIASMLSFQGGIRVPSYTASKSGVMGVTRLMANEWAKHNINVNAIAPGYMATNNTQQLRADEQRSAEILDRIPAGRWGLPSDLMGPVVFLASSASDYVNGYTIAVDGGWLAR